MNLSSDPQNLDKKPGEGSTCVFLDITVKTLLAACLRKTKVDGAWEMSYAISSGLHIHGHICFHADSKHIEKSEGRMLQSHRLNTCHQIFVPTKAKVNLWSKLFAWQ